MFDETLCPYLSGCLLVLVDRRRSTSALFALSSFTLTRGVAGFRLLKLSAKSSVSSELHCSLLGLGIHLKYDTFRSTTCPCLFLALTTVLFRYTTT